MFCIDALKCLDWVLIGVDMHTSNYNSNMLDTEYQIKTLSKNTNSLEI